MTDSTSSPVTISSAVETVDAASRTKAIRINGNALANSIVGGSGKDTLYGGAGNDTILGNVGDDKIFGDAGNDSLNGGDGADVFIYTGGKDVVQDYKAEDLISIAGTAQVTTSGNDVIFTIGTGKITVKNAADKIISYVDAEDEHTYPTATDVRINGKTITLTESYMEDAFDLKNYDSTLQTMDASAVQHDLSIMGNKLANSIVGSAQNDIIDGGAGNDKLFGGDGADTFILSAGKDSIFDYNEDDDIIQFGAKTPTISTTKAGHVIFKLSNTQTVTVIKGVGKTIRYTVDGVEKTYPETVKFNAKGTGATLTAAYTKDTFDINDYGDYAGSVKTINAAQVVHDLTITANKLANRIIGSEENDYIEGLAGKDTILGGDGNDTIYGGKGNDSLSGGDGADIFIYTTGDGNDVITDYAEADKISIVSDRAFKIARLQVTGNLAILQSCNLKKLFHRH